MNYTIKGLIAATYSAFNDDGSLNLAPIEKHAELLARNGVAGVFACGSTGEGVSMTTEERMQHVQRWCDVARNSLTVIAHVGHTSIGDARALAAHAEKAGVHAIGTVAPSVLKPARIEDLVDWCAAVAAKAPNTPYYYYHIPGLTNVRFSMMQYIDLALERIPTFAGIKFTDENLMEFGNCVNHKAGVNMLYGRDEILLSGLVAGAQGAIGSTYNYSAPVFKRVIDAYEQGDMATAMREMTRARESVQILLDFGGGPAGKAMLKMCGVDCGPARLPLRTLSAERYAALQQRLEEFGWDDIRCK